MPCAEIFISDFVLFLNARHLSSWGDRGVAFPLGRYPGESLTFKKSYVALKGTFASLVAGCTIIGFICEEGRCGHPADDIAVGP